MQNSGNSIYFIFEYRIDLIAADKKNIYQTFILFSFFSWTEENSGMILASKWIDRQIYGNTGKQFEEIIDEK